MKKPALAEIETNIEKIYWPREGYTKGDLLEYYKAVSVFLLPHLKDRPMTLVRFPDGIEGKSFFQKEAPDFTPEWISTATVEHSDKVVHYLLIQDLHSLVYAVNLGAIELHPFLSRYQKENFPDFLVLDLDPVEIPFTYVVEVAQGTHKLLQEIGIEHACKTSGKRGMHIYIPLKAKYEYETVKQFGEVLANVIHQSMPNITSLVRDPAKRQKRVYIDYLQNSPTKSVIAPYCVRAIDKAPVSTPLEWSEVKKGLDPTQFTIATMPKRLEKKGDLFEKLLKTGIDIKASLKKLELLYKL